MSEVLLHPPAPPVKEFKYNLEALRGFAGLCVVFTHCFGFSKLLNGTTRHGIWQYDFPGHLAVMVFFILSGYVIGLSTKTPLTWHTTGTYLKKRFLRLYPIYALCLILALIVTDRQYSLGLILANFSFLQVALTDNTYEVGVAWSLNFEALFYLLFVPISIYRVRPALAVGVSLACALLFQHVVASPKLAIYCYGFCFWLVGLWLSKEKVSTPYVYSRYTLAGLACLMLAFPLLNFASEVARFTLHLDRFHGIDRSNPIDILLSDFSYLPLGVLLVSTYTDRRLPYRGILVAFCVVVPLLFALLQVRTVAAGGTVEWASKVVAYAFYLLGVILLAVGARQPIPATNKLPERAIALGSISYGFYLIHFLIIVLLGRIPFGQGTTLTFALRTAVAVVLSLGAGYLLEKVWHPFAIRQLKRLPLFA